MSSRKFCPNDVKFGSDCLDTLEDYWDKPNEPQTAPINLMCMCLHIVIELGQTPPHVCGDYGFPCVRGKLSICLWCNSKNVSQDGFKKKIKSRCQL